MARLPPLAILALLLLAAVPLALFGCEFNDGWYTGNHGGYTSGDDDLFDDDDAIGDDDTGSGDDDTVDDDDDTVDDDDDDASTDTTVTLTLSPLTNGTTYYFAVAAVDTNGDMGSFTEVLAAMPQETGGAAWLAGDPGGYGCDGCTVNVTPMGEFAALGLLLLLGFVRRMKR